jgi:hypothetical protein
MLRELFETDMPTQAPPYKLVGWITALLALGTLVWKASEFRSEVRTDLSWMKTSLATLVTRFNELDVVQTQIKTIDTGGSFALKELNAKVQELLQKVNAYEKYGSPANVHTMESFEGRLSKVEKDLELHKVSDERQHSAKGNL